MTIKEFIFGPSGETKTQMILDRAKELGIKVVRIEINEMTDEEKNGYPKLDK